MLLKAGQSAPKELCCTQATAACIGSVNVARQTTPWNEFSFPTALTAGPSVSAGRSLRLVLQITGPLLLVSDINLFHLPPNLLRQLNRSAGDSLIAHPSRVGKRLAAFRRLAPQG